MTRSLLLISPILAVSALSVTGIVSAEAQAASRFHSQLYENPQPSDPIFAQTWPDLIAENNRANAEGYLHLKPEPGKNLDLFLDNATVDIPGGKAVISIKSGPFAGCRGIGEHHDMNSRAIPCPARITVIRNGTARTSDAGMLCRVGSSNAKNFAQAVFDPKNSSIHVSVVINGIPSDRSEGNDPCDVEIAIP